MHLAPLLIEHEHRFAEHEHEHEHEAIDLAETENTQDATPQHGNADRE